MELLEEFLKINRELWFANRELREAMFNVWKLQVLRNEKEAEIRYEKELKIRPKELVL